MKIGILINPLKADSLSTLEQLRVALEKNSCEVILDQETAALTGEPNGIPAHEFSQHVDIAAVLGGDGTMLNAVCRLGHFEKPVAGINIGTLGFLTSCKDNELELFAQTVASGNFTTSVRTLLQATVRRKGKSEESFTALNEVTLARGETGRLISLRAQVNGELLNNYRADGLIVATPTGSTAYSLSAGGPLISPSAGVFVITPICPHSLSQRSLVLGDDSVIEISSEGRDPSPMIFTVDGRDSVRIEAGDSIEVRKSAQSFRLLSLKDHSFYAALRQKLHWQGV